MKRLHGLVAVLAVGCAAKPSPAPGPLATGANANPPGPASAPQELPAAPRTNPMNDALALIPDGADIIIGVDAAQAVTSEVGELVLEVFEDQLRDVVEASSTCGVGPTAWRLAVFGQRSTTNASVGVFSAHDLGREATLRCLSEQTNARMPQAGFSVSREGDRLVARGQGQTIIAISNDTVAVVDDGWQQAFDGRLEGTEPSAVNGSLREAMTLVDTRQVAFFVGNGPGGEGAAAFDFVTGGFGFTHGVSFSAFFYFADGSKAEENAQVFREQFNQLKGMAGAFGIPSAVVDRVQIESQGRAVHVQAHATTPEIDQILTQVTAGPSQ